MPDRWRRLVGRVKQVEHRELREFRRWIEQTRNLVHLSALFAVPLVIAIVTLLANAVGALSFLVFPPLASGAYMLFSNPEGKYASPLRFVGGLTTGAVCGWVAIVVSSGVLYTTPPGKIHVAGAALAVFLTGAATWGLHVNVPSAYATALLTLFVQGQFSQPSYYVLSVAAGSAIVAATFELWRRSVYERRASYLYESTRGDDHVLVPVRGPDTDATAMLGARLAAAHNAGKVVLLDVVEETWLADAERELLREHGETRFISELSTGETREAERPEDIDREMAGAARESVTRLEEWANDIETRAGVPCEVVVATGGTSPASTVLQAAREANCDLIVSPFEATHGAVSPFVRNLFGGDIDVVVHRSNTGRTEWNRVLVPVRPGSKIAHNMVDFATRLVGPTGQVGVATCIDASMTRRRVEERLADFVEPFEGNIETRVTQTPVEEFMVRDSHEYDLLMIGASQERSAASRFISPPTFERIDGEDLDSDVAIVDRR